VHRHRNGITVTIFGPCNYCGKPLVYLTDGWGAEGDSTAKNCANSPDGWHQADRLDLGDGSFSIGSKVWAGTSKVLEEMGELGQVLGKLIGSHGETIHWDGTDLRLRLEEEIGDVKAAIAFFEQANPSLDRLVIQNRADQKHQLFWRWHLGKE
jgi:hypothetical protein